MSFYLYRENKLEVLAGRFVDEVYNASPAASLIAGKHLIVVQTRGMSEYLRQYIAAECGIAANLEMPFLNSFINFTYSEVCGLTQTKYQKLLDFYTHIPEIVNFR